MGQARGIGRGLTVAWVYLATIVAAGCGESAPTLGDNEQEIGISVGASSGVMDGDGTTSDGGLLDDEGRADESTGGMMDDGSTTDCEGDDCFTPMVCGDGVLDEGEECDDGNPRGGDGCSGTCEIEPNYRCQEPGEACTLTVVCGDGEVGAGENCDDGNDEPNDGCSDECLVEPGYACATPGEPCEETFSSECPNSMVEFPETCDDGNDEPGDGCSAECTIEAGYLCNTPGEPCIEEEYCGNGVLADAGEACDDGNTRPGDGCDGLCNIENFYECPTAGEPCESLIVCGDLNVIGDEECDDGRHCSDGTACTDETDCVGIGDEACQPRSGDGCTEACDQVEPGYTCPTAANVGGACSEVPEPICGDAELNLGEFCDDGNDDPDDGCTDECVVTPGYRCPQVGQRCELIEVCGNGTRGEGESCDDGSVCADGTTDCTGNPDACIGIGDESCAPIGGDGCTVTCAIEAGYTCPTNGGACVSLIVCGDGFVGGAETCDLGGLCEDGTTDCTDDPAVCAGIGGGACLHDDQDGCSACTIETGYTCSPGGNCRATECGDGLRRGLEFCDDGSHCEDGSPCTEDTDCTTGTCEARSGDGCDDSCALEDGFVCETEGQPCTTTDCGDGVAEGTEQCDDANVNLGDGCDPFCRAEPLCDDGPCTSQCGDGIRFADEECDDGNRRNGDGCSDQCQEELGFTCEEPTALPDSIQIPIVIRDFHGEEANPTIDDHFDFEFDNGNGEPRSADQDITRDAGLACVANPGRGGDLGCPGETYDMLDLSGNVIATISLAGKPVFDNIGCDITERPSDANSWNKCTSSVTDADSFHMWYTERPDGVVAPEWTRNPTTVDLLTLANGSFSSDGDTFTPNTGSFSFDSRTMTLLDPSTDPTNDEQGFFPIDDLELTGATCGNGSFNRNFHFTSEVRYWFEYDASVEPTLTFSGDDDVFVYINGYLALDIGGLHQRLEDSFTIDAGNAAAWGLTDGNIYEIAVFQAEREQCESNYWLTLDGFVPRTSVCDSDCGDGILASVEECDDGEENNIDGLYGGCQADCTLGPRCGDEIVQEADGEVCDEGPNFLIYGGDAPGCGIDCQPTPYCGDSEVDGGFGEVCDNGMMNVEAGSPGDYEACRTDCTPSPYCGDGAPTNGEECDDGLDNGTPQSACRTDCTLKCGDGNLDFGEECDDGPMNANGYGTCQLDCTLGRYCGDGIRQAQNGEECDDGRNDGSYGTCAPNCVLGPRCGDDIVQMAAGELCDNGEANGTSGYGDPEGCTTACRPTPYCGDGAVTDGEVCDDGVNDGTPGRCTPGCDDFVELQTCGNGTLNAGEQCDDGSGANGNGALSSDCDVNCRFKCGNGFVDEGEECDNGTNDGSYGTCSPDCSLAGYCGDGQTSGPEECDEGDDNQANPYGEGLCTTGCREAPYCGDGRLEAGREECDGQSNCTQICTIFVG